MSKTAIKSNRIILPDKTFSGYVVIQNGSIAEIVSHIPSDLIQLIDVGEKFLMPGVIDPHVHINEPGRTHWEGFATATRAAAAGGVTTLVDMPLNSSPVTTTVAALEEKRAAADSQCWVDVAFHAGLVPDNLADVEPLLDAGVCGVKAFMCDSGLDEFPATGEREFRQILPLLAQRGVPLLVHAELTDEHATASEIHNYNDWLASRPESFERNAINLLRALCAEYLAPIHVVH